MKNKQNIIENNTEKIFDSEGVGKRTANSENIERVSMNQLYSDLEALPSHFDHFLKHVLIESRNDIVCIGRPTPNDWIL